MTVVSEGVDRTPVAQGRPGVREVLRALGPPAAGCVLLLVALTMPWLTTALGESMGATDLDLQLPWLGWMPLGYEGLIVVSLAVVVVAACADAVAFTTHGARRHAVRLYRSAGGLAVTIAAAALVQLLLVGSSTVERLRTDDSTLALLAGQFSYRVPRPSVDQLLGLPLPDPVAVVVSALRVGWLLCLLGGVLLLATPGRARRPDLASWRRPAWSGVGPIAVSVLVVAVAVATARSLGAVALASDAGNLSAAGDDSTAMGRFDLALLLDPAVGDDPRFAAALGRASTATGARHGEAEAYAAGVDALGQSRESEAIRLLSAGLAAAPGNLLLRTTLAETAARYALRSGDATVLRSLPVQAATTPLVLYTRGRLELLAGDLATSVADMRSLAASTDDTDIRSAALTSIALALQQSGDDLGSRAVLQDALAADPAHLNVVARAMATGLYSGARR